MNYDAEKAKLAIKWSDDLEQVKAIARRFIDLTICVLREKHPDCYIVYDIYENVATKVADGTKDFCLGFCDAYSRGNDLVICVDKTIVWPEERFGATIQ